MLSNSMPLKALSPKQVKVQQKIVLYHNFFRSNVEPNAANMLKMQWHTEAAKAAQRWAQKCQFLLHDNAAGRYIEDYFECGQNIFIASHRVPWFFAIQTWWLEKGDFKYAKSNNLSLIGHYTQLVWATTHEIGCGIAKCHHYSNYTQTKEKTFYNYVCNYCPIGNHPGRLGMPYKEGPSCQMCKNNCKRKLCLNSCKFADKWSNCKQIFMVHPYWLCHSKTAIGVQRLNSCKATCTCRENIYR